MGARRTGETYRTTREVLNEILHTRLPDMPVAFRAPPKALAFWVAAGTILATDIVTKRAAESALSLHVPHAVVGNAIRLTLTYNTGAAMNTSLGDFSRIGFSLIATVMVGVMYRMYRTAAATDASQALALGLICGGALGNLADRVRSARGVVDFIDIGTAGWRFWTFNVADAGVTVGAALLAWILFRRDSAASGGAAAESGPVAGAAPERAAPPAHPSD
jgi:signal peptidase II